MGDRAQVLIEDEGVYLYTHWNGSSLESTVKKALSRKQRWDDPEYLARIIFDEMIGKDQGEETGYGIGGEQHGDVRMLIIVNCQKQTVTIEGCTLTMEEFILS